MSLRQEWEEILYHLYESGGNSKYIRADHVGRPLTPDQAISALLTSLKNKMPKEKEHYMICNTRLRGFEEEQCDCGALSYNTAIKEVSAILESLEGENK